MCIAYTMYNNRATINAIGNMKVPILQSAISVCFQHYIIRQAAIAILDETLIALSLSYQTRPNLPITEH